MERCVFGVACFRWCFVVLVLVIVVCCFGGNCVDYYACRFVVSVGCCACDLWLVLIACGVVDCIVVVVMVYLLLVVDWFV